MTTSWTQDVGLLRPQQVRSWTPGVLEVFFQLTNFQNQNQRSTDLNRLHGSTSLSVENCASTMRSAAWDCHALRLLSWAVSFQDKIKEHHKKMHKQIKNSQKYYDINHHTFMLHKPSEPRCFDQFWAQWWVLIVEYGAMWGSPWWAIARQRSSCHGLPVDQNIGWQDLKKNTHVVPSLWWFSMVSWWFQETGNCFGEAM